MFIVKKPGPTVSYRLVLVPDNMLSDQDSLGRPIKPGMSVVYACTAYEPTPDDLSSIGYAPQATMAALREATGHMRDRAENAEVLVDELTLKCDINHIASASIQEDIDGLLERLEKAERDQDEAKKELARLTAPGDGSEGSDGEPTDEELVRAFDDGPYPRQLRAVYRLGVAHERARQQPAKDRAMDEELFREYDAALIAISESAGEPAAKHLCDAERAGVRAVAARVRKERPGVDEEAVSDVMRVGLAQCDALRRTVAKLTERCEQWEGERNAIAFVLSTPAERRGDYGSVGRATLARLLGEVSRG